LLIFALLFLFFLSRFLSCEGLFSQFYLKVDG
jgi:hypothetical protein